jgi:hypothetical protein
MMHNASHDILQIDNVALPSDEQVVAAGRDVLEATNSWKKGKRYQKNTVQIYSRPKGPGDGASWYCRVSEHTAAEATFDEFWSKIGSNHSENEKECVRFPLRGGDPSVSGNLLVSVRIY